ncbi:MAG: helix-turn-helix transcriptional regulator [Muribaculaceae bacterium]|nr:helix-turn-helix transcriptional regulator [Muribaculaceae bacterium]
MEILLSFWYNINYTAELEEQMKLTPREKEVCNYIIEGYSNAEISKKMFISMHTVKAYTSIVLKKTNAKNRTHLAYLIGSEKVSEM